MEGRQTKLVFKNKEEVRDFFQIQDNGISSDYHNTYSVSFSFCKLILSLEAESVDPYAVNYEKNIENIRQKRDVILKQMKVFPSYLEYLDALKRKHGIAFEEFLTDQGREIIKKMDEVLARIKALCSIDDSKELNIKTLLGYLEEMKKLIDNKEI